MCGSTVCCRVDSPDVINETDRPGKWGYLGKCDIPFVSERAIAPPNREPWKASLTILPPSTQTPASSFGSATILTTAIMT